MATIEEILGYNFYNNAVLDYLIAVAVFVAVILVAQFFKYQVVQFLKRLSKRTKSDFDDFLIDVIDGIGWPLYIILGLYAGVKFLEVPSLVHTAMHVLLVVIAAYYAIKSVQSIIDYGAGRVTKRKEKEGDKDTTVIDLFKKLLKVALWLAVFLVLLSSLGIDISGAVVGLGVTGIVLGFALQNILGALFASFSLYFDKPLNNISSAVL